MTGNHLMYRDSTFWAENPSNYLNLKTTMNPIPDKYLKLTQRTKAEMFGFFTYIWTIPDTLVCFIL